MKKTTYFAVFEPCKGGGYSVYFPDLPGCTSAGDDYAQAAEMATEALGLHLYEMEKDGDDIPLASLPSELEIYPETEKDYLVSPVSTYLDLVKNRLDNRAVKTNLTIPAWLKEAAEEQNINFSQVLQAALKEQLQIR